MRKPSLNDAPMQTATDAGWHPSRYNVWARIPDDPQRRFAVANLYRGSFGVYTPLGLAALSMLDTLPATHPSVERLAERGIIVNFDERAAIASLVQKGCKSVKTVSLVICPTLGCNFDCPYCFEDHHNVRMSSETQNDVVALAERMLEASDARELFVTWYGGEPLLALDIVDALSQRFIDLSENRGTTYSSKMVTNGYLLSLEAVETLEQSRISVVQVTLDGLGDAHNVTRHLADGRDTFDCIVANLSRPGLPFAVDVRHNLYGGNSDTSEELRAFVKRLADESSNNITFYASLVNDTQTARQRGQQVDILDGRRASDAMLSSVNLPTGVRPIHCGAPNPWEVTIDPKGRLHKCWENVDKPDFSFGNARDWDPGDAWETASRPDFLTCYLNCTSPADDDECTECLWLPICAGGCPQRRLFGPGRQCIAYKDDPSGYALALWRKEPAR